jgi:hypothetical protein
MTKMEMRSYISMDSLSDVGVNSLDLCEQCFEEFGVWTSEILLREAENDK